MTSPSPGEQDGPVVQLVRTLACDARGRRFEPVPGRHMLLWLSWQSTSLVRTRSRVRIALAAPSSTVFHKEAQCFLFFLQPLLFTAWQRGFGVQPPHLSPFRSFQTHPASFYEKAKCTTPLIFLICQELTGGQTRAIIVANDTIIE